MQSCAVAESPSIDMLKRWSSSAIFDIFETSIYCSLVALLWKSKIESSLSQHLQDSIPASHEENDRVHESRNSESEDKMNDTLSLKPLRIRMKNWRRSKFPTFGKTNRLALATPANDSSSSGIDFRLPWMKMGSCLHRILRRKNEHRVEWICVRIYCMILKIET